VSLAESAPASATESDLADATAVELLARFAAGTATPTQATQACLARIEATEPSVNAGDHAAGRAGAGQAAESDARGSPAPPGRWRACPTG